MSNEEATQDGPQGTGSHYGQGPGDLDMPLQSSLTVIWAEEKAELHRRIEALEHSVLVLQLHLSVKTANQEERK